jgi:adenylylsulfate kinase
MRETKKRSLVKGISYRLQATVATSLLVYLIIGEIDLALQIGLADSVVKLAIYFFNERLWNKVDWGYETKTIKKS